MIDWEEQNHYIGCYHHFNFTTLKVLSLLEACDDLHSTIEVGHVPAGERHSQDAWENCLPVLMCRLRDYDVGDPRRHLIKRAGKTHHQNTFKVTFKCSTVLGFIYRTGVFKGYTMMSAELQYVPHQSDFYRIYLRKLEKELCKYIDSNLQKGVIVHPCKLFRSALFHYNYGTSIYNVFHTIAGNNHYSKWCPTLYIVFVFVFFFIMYYSTNTALLCMLIFLHYCKDNQFKTTLFHINFLFLFDCKNDQHKQCTS